MYVYAETKTDGNTQASTWVHFILSIYINTLYDGDKTLRLQFHEQFAFQKSALQCNQMFAAVYFSQFTIPMLMYAFY